MISLHLLSHLSSSQILYQQQLVYNGGTSARNLPGYSEWQSFTAGMSGTMCQIKMGFFNYINGTGTLKIFSGFGTAGALKQSQSVSVYCPSGNCMITFNVSVVITSGQIYTFQFIPGAGIPDPYGVQVAVPGTYSGGQMALVDPSGTYYPGFDLVFQTYVCPVLPIKLENFEASRNDNNQIEIFWTTASELNNNFFTVEKSRDGIIFIELTMIEGAGTSFTPLNYQTEDANPFPGTNYYRLKQTDFNGEVSYSTIISVQPEQSVLNVSSYYDPNSSTLIVTIHSATTETANVKLYDVAGIRIQLLEVATNSEFRIGVQDFQAGIYFLKVNTGSKSIIQKIIVN